MLAAADGCLSCDMVKTFVDMLQFSMSSEGPVNLYALREVTSLAATRLGVGAGSSGPKFQERK
eukprot:scaffold651153_cov41-Prasinocladus_malaysianus.AAC.1